MTNNSEKSCCSCSVRAISGFSILARRAIGHGGSRGDAQQLACQASLAEEVTVAQNGDDRFLALLGCHRELHLASSQVEHGIRRFSLPEDGAVRAVF